MVVFEHRFAQILKNTWIINPQLSGFNLGSTHTEDTGKETFDLGLKVEAGNFIANNLAILVGIGGDFAWNKEYKDNSIDIVGALDIIRSRLYFSA